MSRLTLYARKEPTTDPVSVGLRLARFDTVAYADRQCTKPMARWTWHLSNCPRKLQPSAFVNSARFNLEWLPDVQSTVCKHSLNESRVDNLLRDIGLANNGYLNMQYMLPGDRAFAIQCADAGLVAITKGVVHAASRKPGFVSMPIEVKSIPLKPEMDMEGAILRRQESAGCFD